MKKIFDLIDENPLYIALTCVAGLVLLEILKYGCNVLEAHQ